MIVMKFGGTSVNSAQKIQTIYQIIKRAQHKKPIIVVSAHRGVTDLLLTLPPLGKLQQEKILAQILAGHIDVAGVLWQGKIPKNLITAFQSCMQDIRFILAGNVSSKSVQDSIIANGEILSSYLVSSGLIRFGIPTMQVSATKLIVTNDAFGEAEYIPELTIARVNDVLIPLIRKGKVPVITGFIGATKNGEITTLGRGGSDYSASILGYCLGTDEVQFWKDVDGMYTADPRKEKNAKLLQNLSYEKASQLIHDGAKILHPRTIYPLLAKNIPIRVMNSYSPEKQGTFIGNAKGDAV